ncbi:COG4223 family protein [Microvirga sp. TS319]|uniref:COG4223 family protein n=1 Tax=Microvirga sp. TS319 TaxID=3241165 RepID=UPI003519E529
MTDSSDPKAPKTSRRKPAREPATIDLKATVVDEGVQPGKDTDKAWDAVKPEETIMPKAEAPAEDSPAPGEAAPDSGLAADTLGAGAAADEGPPPPPDEPDSASSGPAPAPAPERRGSAAALIGSGLLGGLIGAGLVYGLGQWQQTSPAPEDPRIAQLEQRVSALSQSRPAPQQPGPQNVDLSPIEERLRVLEEARAPLDQRLQEIQDAANRAAARAEEALNRPLPEPAAPPSQNDAALTELSGRVADLSNRLGALEKSDRLETVENTVRTLEGEVRAGAQSAAGASNAVQDLNRRLGEQDQRLAALSQQVAESGKSAEAAGQTSTRVVLTERLSDALRNGTPYAEVLDALRKNGADAGRLQALEPFAEKGAPTAAALRASFEPLEAQILRDERSASGEWSDRVLRMLDKVVTVRPVNEPNGTGAEATAARIRQALASGDVSEAAAAWSSLPEPARRISEAWGRQVQAVAEARQASRDLSGEALAALNRSTQ